MTAFLMFLLLFAVGAWLKQSMRATELQLRLAVVEQKLEVEVEARRADARDLAVARDSLGRWRDECMDWRRVHVELGGDRFADPAGFLARLDGQRRIIQ